LQLRRDFGFRWKATSNLSVIVELNPLVSEEPSDLGMRVPPPTTNFDGLIVTMTEN
jgi:hypothetical protein